MQLEHRGSLPFVTAGTGEEGAACGRLPYLRQEDGNE